MKKNLVKLALSGAALAAVAATLGTSTYAWYTANATVSATGVSGASAGAADASIFISKDHDAWSSTVEMEAADITGGSLLPVEFISDTSGHTVTFKDLGTADGSTYTEGSSRLIANGAAKKFTLYFRSSLIAADADAPTVYLKGISLTNTTTGTFPTADNLYYLQSEGYGVDTDQASYKVDFLQALKMVIKTNAATGSNVNDKSLDLQNYYDEDDVAANTSLADDADALGYYNNIMGTTLTSTMDARQNQSVITAKNASGESRTKVQLGTLPKDASYITVDFWVYLDGWDTYCYDACKGQTFQLDLEFTSDADEALTYAA